MSELQAGLVTIGDLYREIVGMRSDVARALTRIEVIDSHNTATAGDITDHENRLRGLEAFKWKLTGIAMAVGMVSGLFSGYVVFLIGHR